MIRQTLSAPLYESGGPDQMRSLSELRSQMHGEGEIIKRTRAVSARPILYDNMPEERICGSVRMTSSFAMTL